MLFWAVVVGVGADGCAALSRPREELVDSSAAATIIARDKFIGSNEPTGPLLASDNSPACGLCFLRLN